MILEICSNSYESAVAAMKGGAHRIELCTDLSVGGLSPSEELIEKTVNDVDIPIHVLIRPRAGNFNYSEEEINRMIHTIEFCKRSGCQGIVSGVLDSNVAIDLEKTQMLIEASKGMNFTFHRAFDLVHEPLVSIEKLKELNIDFLLSSGQESVAINGLNLLMRMKDASENKFDIMPGGGILIDHVSSFKDSGFSCIHLSATKKLNSLNIEDGLFNTSYEGVSDIETIKEVISQLS